MVLVTCGDSENPLGADNQQETELNIVQAPQRLHARPPTDRTLRVLSVGVKI